MLSFMLSFMLLLMTRSIDVKIALKSSHGSVILRNTQESVPRRKLKRTEDSVCGTCKKSFTQKFTLFDHEQKKHHPTRLGFTCDICGSQFVTEDEQRKHLVHEHGEADVVMNLECGLCEKIFSTIADLNGHVCRREKVHW